MMHAALNGYDDIVMYLSLRTRDVDSIDKNSGQTVFSIYLMKSDIHRMKQLLKRGAEIDYFTNYTINSEVKLLTPLHAAIENN